MKRSKLIKRTGVFRLPEAIICTLLIVMGIAAAIHYNGFDQGPPTTTTQPAKPSTVSLAKVTFDGIEILVQDTDKDGKVDLLVRGGLNESALVHSNIKWGTSRRTIFITPNAQKAADAFLKAGEELHMVLEEDLRKSKEATARPVENRTN